MIIKKVIINNKNDYDVFFCDACGLIDFFKIDERTIHSFENIMNAHRPKDKDYKYIKIFNEDIMTFHLAGFTILYQFIYNPETYEIITVSRISINNKLAEFSMVHTNSNYRGQKFCQKNINLFIDNVLSLEEYQDIKKFSLYVRITNIPAIKCYESCGFVNISTDKEHHLMEKNI